MCRTMALPTYMYISLFTSLVVAISNAQRLLNIAHRGASGVRPEHTEASYRLAIQQGADVIECDVCVTKDLQLVCLHESWISAITNVEEVFPGRENTYYIDDIGINITDYFSVDFTLAELKQVKMSQRFSSRDDGFDYQYPIMSLDEYISIAQGGDVGIYPETKHPLFVNNLEIVRSANTTFEQLLVDALQRRGINETDDNCYLQSFSEQSLRDLARISRLKKIQLMIPVDDVSEDKLRDLAQFCFGIGVHKAMIVEVDPTTNRISGTTDLIANAHRAGLHVHAWTMRNEYRFMPFDYGHDPFVEYQQFHSLGVDGCFTDFPATFNRFISSLQQ